MKITESIKEFRKVLLILESGCCSQFICCNSNNYEFKSLFRLNGYYKNYMDGPVLKTPYNNRSQSYFLNIKWKIKFIKQEIKELTVLLKEDYTDI